MSNLPLFVEVPLVEQLEVATTFFALVSSESVARPVTVLLEVVVMGRMLVLSGMTPQVVREVVPAVVIVVCAAAAAVVWVEVLVETVVRFVVVLLQVEARVPLLQHPWQRRVLLSLSTDVQMLSYRALILPNSTHL